MSRIGKTPIDLPKGVEVTEKDGFLTVKGPKGVLSQQLNSRVELSIEENQIVVTRKGEQKEDRAMHGLYRALIHNMVVGVTDGFKKTLELVGVGYRVSNQGQLLELSVGYTHPIFLLLPDEVKVETKTERNKNPFIYLESCDKQLLGQVCAKIRSFRKPEPYKGKGIKFENEYIRRKSGKSATK